MIYRIKLNIQGRTHVFECGEPGLSKTLWGEDGVLDTFYTAGAGGKPCTLSIEPIAVNEEEVWQDLSSLSEGLSFEARWQSGKL